MLNDIENFFRTLMARELDLRQRLGEVDSIQAQIERLKTDLATAKASIEDARRERDAAKVALKQAL